MSQPLRVSGMARRPDPNAEPSEALRAVGPSAAAAVAKAAGRAKLPAAVELLTRRPDPSTLARRLDTFLEKARPTFQVGGRAVRVPLHFASAYGSGQARMGEALRQIQGMLGPERFRELAGDVSAAIGTRGQPESIRRTVQALIDAGALQRFGGADPAVAVRKLMFSLGIGLDCIGYSLAAAQYARGRGDTSASASSFGIKNRFHFDFGAMPKVSLAAARVGDVLHTPAVSEIRQHNVIIRDNRVVPVKPGETFVVAGRKLPPQFVQDATELRVFTVDSSWGGGPRGDYGGAERRAWIFNPKTQQWGSFSAGGHFSQGPAPDDHPKIFAVRVAGTER